MTLSLTACAARDPSVYIFTLPHQVDGHNYSEAYTPAELDHVVRQWAKDSHLPFDFKDHVAVITVPADRQCLAILSYGVGMGKKGLTVILNDHAQVIDHWIAIGICGEGETR